MYIYIYPLYPHEIPIPPHDIQPGHGPRGRRLERTDGACAGEEVSRSVPWGDTKGARNPGEMWESMEKSTWKIMMIG